MVYRLYAEKAKIQALTNRQKTVKKESHKLDQLSTSSEYLGLSGCKSKS
jgi:hypothetical protein